MNSWLGDKKTPNVIIGVTFVFWTRHAEGLVDPDFRFLREHVESENIKYQIGYGSSLY
jgi:hypothetical protein